MARPSARSSAAAAGKPTNTELGSSVTAELPAEDVIVAAGVDLPPDVTTTAYGIVQHEERDLEGRLQYQVVKYMIRNGEVISSEYMHSPTMYKALVYQYLERVVQGEYLQGTMHDAEAMRALNG